tara:strand:+ start:322 stop:600 length:279 start_codon:yes stop_codon:yes gene_type:complete
LHRHILCRTGQQPLQAYPEGACRSFVFTKDDVRVPRRDNYEKRPVLSTTIHPDLKRTLVTMSERTGMSVSQVTDEVLYTGLVEMQELEELEE